jgi:hypothetical protein
MRSAFEWFVGGKPVVISDDSGHQGVWCERGCYSGKAVFCVRQSDADALDLDAKVDIVVKRYDGDANTLAKTTTFKDYYVVRKEIAENRDKNVIIELRDKRVLLERAAVNTEYNTVKIVTIGSGSSTTYYTFYVEEFCQASNVPYTMQEIVDELFTLAELTAPAISGSPSDPDNIAAKGTCAEVIQGLLASMGCDLVLDPFTGSLTIELLSGSQDVATMDAAIANGQSVDDGLHEITLASNDKWGKVVISPADWFPVQYVTDLTTTFGDGKRTAVIRDYQIAESTGAVKSARATEIQSACSAWFKAQDDVFRDSLWGIVEQAPGTDIRCVYWKVEGGRRNDIGTRTIVENNAIPIPWAKRTEYEVAGYIRGKTIGTLSATPVKVAYWKQNVDGSFTDTEKCIYAVTYIATIPADKDLAIWPGERTWIAQEIC